MKQVDEMPASGQFVAVWVYEGELWSEVYINNGESVSIYNSLDDEWDHESIAVVKHHFEKYKAKYFIAS